MRVENSCLLESLCRALFLRFCLAGRGCILWQVGRQIRTRPSGNWAAVSNGKAGKTLALVSPYPEVRLMDWGDAGGHLGFWEKVSVPPMGTTQRIVYCVLCDSVKSASQYAALKDLK